MNEYLSWILSTLGLIGFFLAGRKVWWWTRDRHDSVEIKRVGTVTSVESDEAGIYVTGVIDESFFDSNMKAFLDEAYKAPPIKRTKPEE